MGKKVYQSLSGVVYQTKESAEDYYGGSSAFNKALKSNILFKVIVNDDNSVIGTWGDGDDKLM